MSPASPSALTVTTGAFTGSRKVYCDGVVHKDIRVPMREILLSPAADEPNLLVYDTSGAYTDEKASV